MQMLIPDVKKINGQKKKPTKTSTNTFRKEFKFHGSVDTKACLSVVSIMCQIDSGLKRGYIVLEIVDAVIRDVSSSTGLRNYSEGIQDLSIPALRQFLRTHYQEKSATELYGQLGQLFQSFGEEA